MNKEEFKKAITKNLNKALENSLKQKLSNNPNRSAYFCFQVGKQLSKSIAVRYSEEQINRRQIKFDENNERVSGEWLLDILWCAELQPDCKSVSKHPSKIYAALECESSTSGEHFFEDFAKLVHVQSDIKIFLAGMDQVTPDGMRDYIANRTNQAAQFLENCAIDPDSQEWYLAFWPSPAKNLWESLPNHLNRVYVFELKDREFVAF